MDKYTLLKCCDGDGAYFFLKNGVLHREFGPAYISEEIEDKSKYLNLGDEHLYEEKITSDFYLEGFTQETVSENIFVPSLNAVVPAFVILTHYINGQAYTKKDFKKFKRKAFLKKKLDAELPVNQVHSKKIKI
jgi:hypothetical protein